MSTLGSMISVVVADDELPAIDELTFLLSRVPQVCVVARATSGAGVLRILESQEVNAIFLDIHMPGLSGLALAGVLAGMERPPAVVFVTADEDKAVAAYDLAALDYLLKPVRPERLMEAVRRVCAHVQAQDQTQQQSSAAAGSDVITVDQGGIAKMIRREDISYVTAQGDYARLHTANASYLVRIPLSDLVEQWQDAGFHRIHRSYLISMASVSEVRLVGGRASVMVAGTLLPVSRRHLPGLRSVLESMRIRPQA